MLKFSTNPSSARLCFPMAFVLGASILCSGTLLAQENVDVTAYFQRTYDTRGAGLARKTKPVDARPAQPGEVIVTMIKGEGKETQSLRQNLTTWWFGIAVRKPEMRNFLLPLDPFPEDMKDRSAPGPEMVGCPIDQSAYRCALRWLQSRTVSLLSSRHGEKEWWHGPGTRSFKILTTSKIPIDLQKRPSRAPTRTKPYSRLSTGRSKVRGMLGRDEVHQRTSMQMLIQRSAQMDEVGLARRKWATGTGAAMQVGFDLESLPPPNRPR